MAKIKTVYVCSNCGYESSKWNGKCPSCNEWNTFEEKVQTPVIKSNTFTSSHNVQSLILKLTDVDTEDDVRYSTGMTELDRVLGGGLVKGSLVLLGGEPGIGKSTLLLQICQHFGEDNTILYISGEESVRQIKIRAERLNVTSDNLSLLSANDALSIISTISEQKPGIVIIDSIQTMTINEISSSAGSITQVRECTNLFMKCAKSEGIPIFLVGHVNKDGAIAGPKVMEHIVDAVLFFEGERNLSYRILRTIKNRYGSTNEIGVFEMMDKGLSQVENPSQMLISGRPHGVSGSCIACVMEGSRPILAEVQALVTKSGIPSPRRMAKGFDYNRLAIILAVLEKRAGLFFGTLDVYINVVGGLRLDDTGADLSIAIALYSAVLDKPVDEHLIAFGEIGLGGEIRNVTNISQRIKEAERLGFTRCFVPKMSLKNIDCDNFKIQIIGVSSLKSTFQFICQ